MTITKTAAALKNIIAVIILILTPTFFVPVAAVAEEATSLVPELMPKKYWQLSNAEGPVDWSPVEDILAVTDYNSMERGKITVYGTNGTVLFNVAELDGINEYLSPPRFSPDGKKVAYFHHPYNSTSQLQIFDIEGKSEKTVTLENNIDYFDWGADENEIIYATPEPGQKPYAWPQNYQILMHDLVAGTESVVADSISALEYLDVSPSGSEVAFIQVKPVDRPCTPGEYSDCWIDQLVVMPLSGTSSPGSIDPVSSSEVIAQITSPESIGTPRWTSDGSKLTFAAGLLCHNIMAVSRDGATNQTLISWEQAKTLGGCYNFGASFNKDSSMVAYNIGYGGIPFDDSFHPVNAGLYLSFTELCNHCSAPSKTIAILQGESLGGLSVYDEQANLSYLAYSRVGYGEYLGGTIDEQQKKLTIQFKNPMAGHADERDVVLYLPSKMIGGEMNVFVNGTHVYPRFGEDDPCLSRWPPEYCAKMTASVEKIDGWSIITIYDDTTDPRDTATIEITGTSAIPEVGTLAAMAMLAGIICIVLIANRVRNRNGALQ